MGEGTSSRSSAGADAPSVPARAPETSGRLNLVDLAQPSTAAAGRAAEATSELRLAPLEYNWQRAGDAPPRTAAEPGDSRPYAASWAEHQPEIASRIEQLVESGNISKPVKNLKVVYQDHNSELNPDVRVSPDFIVRKDGTVVVSNNTARKPDDPLVIEVERDKGETGTPPEAQQKALDGLARHITETYMEKTPEGRLSGKIDDAQGLISESTKQSIAPNVLPSDLPGPARQQTEAVNRWSGSGGGAYGGDGGRFTPSQQSEYFPQRDVPRQAEESDKLAAIKDVVAGFATRGKKEPYYHVEHRPPERGGLAVGRYGINANGMSAFCDWLSGLSEEQIEELIRKGVLPKNIKQFMQKLKSQEGQDFLRQLKEGQAAPNKEQIDEFFGKETQEAAGSYLITKFAQETANEDGSTNIGKIALAMQLGRTPTADDLNNSDYQNMMQAADKAYPLSLQRILDGTATIDLSDKAKSIAAMAKADVGKALWTEYAAITQNGQLGCAASVSKVLRQAQAVPPGFNENAVYGLDNALQRQGWQPVDFNRRQAGDVIIAYRTSNPAASTGGGAHTGIVGENGATYSNSSNSGAWSYNDANSWIPPNGGYVRTYVLRPPSSNA